ncbi:gliding motility-associated ABC transporter ATP-binding subunit GldA [Aureibaculum sp. 2210JD6-5]|uniref:gliding motility-associated ABC transporter ATP-binding subunit GldA n=1 Tax=Aureibaculum sp. 2210JD6-5 TaxID=3103957 RepID=UPI002AAD9B8B|nr:gliding motility-associated ABC transporter ATP-binding subunit GldA [Aureibaculum sp. 2210JD6-5]MDY7394732.1 gliding motility-associated ABC transporter ATP-binding subunit GldA [Aureibaculum sp. 2210JD6-5]
MSIEVQQISKIYGTQKALNNVSFKINSGEIVGFLGPNGAGKSTMMKIITTYINASDGVVMVNGHNVATEPILVKQSVGYLPEHNPLYLDMYVKEYIQFNASVHRVSKERIQEVIEQVGLTPEAHKKIGQLSKGYRQRVGLAAALLHDPEVLILDEPTTGLDPNQLVEIRGLIKEIGKTKTVLFSTHIMQEVEAVCDRVIIINKGQIVTDKKLNELKGDKEQVIEVEFDLRVEPQLLNQIPKLKSVENIHDNIWQLTFNTSKDMRPAIFDFAHDNGLKLLQSSLKNQDLESLFRSLTK